jgi:hypothetical protein
MKFALFSLVMNIPNAVSGETVQRRAIPRTAWSSSAMPHANRPLMHAAAPALPEVVQP